ncbi:hypothetical protein A9264_09390 [Vibrio sp. UCD-FRSSP16_10]|uniref:TetR/AcrR family transcriptional regulator n=1 Tax=unclassified Vibrio TaxID=2614977 RepID=UPI0007FC4915|nr:MULTISPECIES: TetR/AcrR family transcriptional regulator [unclassified Vibrio]OBT16934.1 hypothetical protein A9260_09615 [Vibrio sp. UCD-FRSSP16_30]OBT21925.1 hypothetical protein A9264_09390 [Vibrio sp. UCD-FRSSP16_10]
MAKITAEQRSINLERYTKKVLDIFWRDGWDGVTHLSVASELGIRKSTLQSYFPDKVSFGQALRGKVLPEVMKHLDLSTPDKFKQSWEDAMNDLRFKRIVHMLVINATSKSTSDMTVGGINRLQGVLAEAWQDEDLAQDVMYWVLGASVMTLAKREA